MRGSIFFALLCVALAEKITSDFFNPPPKTDPVPPKRMPYLSKYTNDELWRIQNQIIRQNQQETVVRYGGADFRVTRLTADANGPYGAVCGDHYSNPSRDAFVNLATHLINTGAIGDNRVGGDQLTLPPVEDIQHDAHISTVWMPAGGDIPGIFTFEASFGTRPHAVGITVPATAIATISVGGNLDIPLPTPSPNHMIRSLSLNFRPSWDDVLTAAPHINFHFSLLSSAQRGDITTGNAVCVSSIATPPATGIIPGAFISSAVCTTNEGVRYFDSNSAERKANNATLFTKSLNYGAINGAVAFVEPMVTVQSLNPTTPTFRASCQPIPQPANWGPASGFFPTRWCVQFDPLASAHVVSLDRFLWVGAPPA